MHALAGRCRRVLVIALAIVVATLVLPPGATAATPSIWGPVTPFGVAGQMAPVISSIACTSAGNCVAVGDRRYADRVSAFVATQRNGVWDPPNDLAVLPADAADGAPGSLLSSVACRDASSCVAVGAYQPQGGGVRALVVPIGLTNGVAAPGTPITMEQPSRPPGEELPPEALAFDGLNAVSCTAVLCTAVGFAPGLNLMGLDAIAVTSADWAATRVPAPAGRGGNVDLYGISCPAVGACQAVGSYADATVDENTFPWTTRITDGVASEPLTVPMPADAAPSNTMVPAGAGTIINGLGEISCPSDGFCTAVGGYSTNDSSVRAVAIPIVAGQPQDPIAPTGFSPGGISTLSGVSCSTATECSVAGFTATAAGDSATALVGARSGSSVATSPLPTGFSGANFVLALGCSATGACSAGGFSSITTPDGPEGQAWFSNSAPTLTVTTTTLPAATVGQPYTATLRAAGGGQASKTWSITAGSLPAGLIMDTRTGVISGTPSAASQGSFVAAVTDDGPPAQTASTPTLALTVAPAPAVGPPPVAKVSISAVRTKGTKVKVTLACVAAHCTGNLKLTRIVKAKKQRITLATGRYATRPGSTQKVTLTLTRPAAQLLKNLGRLKAKLAVTATGQKTPAATRTVKLRWTATR